MTPHCVCGHLESSHPQIGNTGCIGNRNLCHCPAFELDDGTDGIADDSCLGPGRIGGYALDDQ